jgi:hypothetical protein
MRRNQHPAIGPEPHRRRALEFADIDVERRAAQMIALQRVGKSFLVDDLSASDRRSARSSAVQSCCLAHGVRSSLSAGSLAYSPR